MRILLAQPPLDVGSEAAPPLGLCTLAAFLNRRGDQVRICDLDLDGSVSADPAADLFARNLIEAAMDPDSTKNLRPVPSHEQMLKGVQP